MEFGEVVPTEHTEDTEEFKYRETKLGELRGEPGFGGGEIGGGEAVGGFDHLLRHFGSAGPKKGREAGRMVERDDGIGVAVEKEDAFAGEGRRGGGLAEDYHRTEEHSAAEDGGPELEDRGGDIGAVGETDGGEASGIETVVCRGGGDEVGESVGASGNLGGIEYALGEAGEEAERAMFGNVAARAEDGGTRRKGASKRKEVMLVAAGAVEEQERRGGGIGAGLEDVMVGKIHRGGRRMRGGVTPLTCGNLRT